MKIILPFEKTYLPGAGRCIYCWPERATTANLGREHIIPDKLGGKLILHQAACKECERKINREIETPTLTRMWLHPRTHLQIKTSTPRTSLPVGTWTADTPDWPNMDDVDFDFEDISLEQHPFRIVIPRFKPPGILWGCKLTEKFEIVGISAYAPTPDPPKAAGKQSAEFQPFSPDIICRSVAKIAHSAAVAELGLDAFTPMLSPIILGTDLNISNLVGSSLTRGRVREGLHRIELTVSGEYVVAKVQLFARYGLQPFLAVVGRAAPTLIKWQLSTTLRSRVTDEAE
jgi:hypothetical protein